MGVKSIILLLLNNRTLRLDVLSKLIPVSDADTQ